MDWYCGSGINDVLVPTHEDVWDRLPSPDTWSNWGMNASEGFNSPKKFSTMDTSSREVEFNFNDESFNNEIELESSLLEKAQSSSSSVCGGLPEQSIQQTALSCDQLQDVSRFEHMDDIFLDSMLEALPNVENLRTSSGLSSNLQFGGLPQGIEVSNFVPCNSTYDDYQDVKVPPVKFLGPFEQSSTDEGINQQSFVEESILQDLEMAISLFSDKTRICFRDALYRLARNTQQQHVVQDQNVDPSTQRTAPQTDHSETTRYEEKKPMESETNSIDRAIANLMFNKMDINVQELPLTTSSVHSKQETNETKHRRGKPSKALNQGQTFHHNHPCPYPLNLKSNGAEVPRFDQTNLQTAADSRVMHKDPTKKSFMLEFG
ncbi:hypothetical protein QN277_010774 [Acacia crassicarpa]|uniref:Protein LNK3 n=1 Tax=Acacia crassicarpa TaxID=499986 RepID=A0AAE1JKM1_9FABA|nr:hypothetical protein QN277_010774 [Acacia crassicarpa]